MLIFEKSVANRKANAQQNESATRSELPAQSLRHSKPLMPALSELEVVRHFTKLSQLNFSIDGQFYPLGSCTMKYNPRGVHQAAELAGFRHRHPLISAQYSQGILQCLYELQTYLANITGMSAVSLSPMAGSQGEFAGVAMIKAYHEARGDQARQEIIVPEAAHGTNPASAVMCGYKVRELPADEQGDIDLNVLREMVGPQTAGIMLTNPSTLGVFERQIREVADLIHQAGGLLYYDGANLNAILGKVRPGDMGFDVMHLNLHKTFATPHGGGGPGSGPVAAADSLKDYLPIPRVTEDNGQYRWLTATDCPQSIGRLSAFMGNAGILLRAYAYIRVLGAEGLERVAEFATLNANYLQAELARNGFELAYPKRLASHEFIISFKKLSKTHGVSAMDFAKRLLDFDCHAPTTYFPLLVPECFLIEPTETESKGMLDRFVETMVTVQAEAEQTPEKVTSAPHRLSVKRLDDVKAVRELDVCYQAEE